MNERVAAMKTETPSTWEEERGTLAAMARSLSPADPELAFPILARWLALPVDRKPCARFVHRGIGNECRTGFLHWLTLGLEESFLPRLRIAQPDMAAEFE